MKHASLVVLGLIALGLLTGCAQKRKPLPEDLVPLANLAYPAEPAQVKDLDILVERDGKRLMLINRTPNVYNDVQIWLNHEFVGRADTIAIGPDNVFDLTRFVNYRQERYPVAGFLAPDKAFPVILAELHDPATDTRYRLVVAKDDAPRDLR